MFNSTTSFPFFELGLLNVLKRGSNLSDTPTDLKGILDLQKANLAYALTPDEICDQGF